MFTYKESGTCVSNYLQKRGLFQRYIWHKNINLLITNNKYILLLVALCVSFTSICIPFDILELKNGLYYILWFTLGFVFEKEREKSKKWDYKKSILAIAILIIIEYVHAKYAILNSFFVIPVGSFLTYLVSDICSRRFAKFTQKKLWKIIYRNLFNVYLFHDPLEYVVLRIFFEYNFLSSNVGCYLYTISRTFVIFMISIAFGEFIRAIKNAIVFRLMPIIYRR